MALKVTADMIRKLREITGAPVIRAKKVLEEVMGDLPADATRQALQAGEKKAEKILREEGYEAAQKKVARKTHEGLLFSYVHHSGKVASLVELLCETDFVARNKLFQDLGHNLALQVAAMNPKNVDELMEQEFINPSGLQPSLVKDPSNKILDLVKDVIAKTGENVRISRIYRVELGE